VLAGGKERGKKGGVLLGLPLGEKGEKLEMGPLREERRRECNEDWEVENEQPLRGTKGGKLRDIGDRLSLVGVSRGKKKPLWGQRKVKAATSRGIGDGKVRGEHVLSAAAGTEKEKRKRAPKGGTQRNPKRKSS